MGKSWRINPHIVCDFALVIILQLNSFSIATASNKSCIFTYFFKKELIRMYALIFFPHPKKRDRKRNRDKQKHAGFGQRCPFFHSHPSAFSVLAGGKGEKKHIQLKIHTLLSFHVPFLSLWDTMMLTWSIIPYSPWQFLNTNFLLASFFISHSLLSIWQLIALLFLSSELHSCHKAQLEGHCLLADCFVLHPLT